MKFFRKTDITNLGEMIGIEELMEPEDNCFGVLSENGKIIHITVYENGIVSSEKKVGYENEKVVFLALLKNGKEVDTWFYKYHPIEGYRTEKLVALPGKPPHIKWIYDKAGNKIQEIKLNGSHEA